MAMLRRLHALSSKTGSDPAAHLLRTLSSRSSHSSTAHDGRGASPVPPHIAYRAELGAIGPSRSRGRPLNSPNRGLCGLPGTGEWRASTYSPGMGGRGVAVRSVTGGAEPKSHSDEDEESTLSSLLDELDEVRARGGIEVDSDDLDGSDGGGGVDARASRLQQANSGERGDLDTFDINPRLKRQLRAAGVQELFPVQAQCFEKVVSGQDLMCKSRTGSGKTLAFAIPIIEALDRQSGGESVQNQRGGRGRLFSRGAYGRAPRAICVTPTRELAKQVEREFNRIAPELSSLAVYGGTALGPQIGEMRRGVDIIVGTPGRIIDHLEQGHLNLSEIQFCVLDEADLMLQMGFQESVEDIFKGMPDNKQTTLWSATMPRWVQQLSRKYLHSPEFIDLVGEDDVKIPSTITHWSFATQAKTRSDILGLVATVHGSDKRSIVFTQTKAEVDELCTHPSLSRIGAEALHGGLSQAAREACLGRFRSGRTKMIVATDVAARGLDISGVDMVFHYRLPNDMESFVHRSGRTGRAGKSGINVVLCSSVEDRQLAALEKEYSFKSVRRSPPSGLSSVQELTEEIRNKILSVSAASVRMYEPEAAKLLGQLGLVLPEEASLEQGEPSRVVPAESVQALSAAMALLGGGSGVTAECFSMIDGMRGMQTLLIKGSNIRDSRDAGSIVQFINSSQMRPSIQRYRLCDQGFLVDVPQETAQERLEDINSRFASVDAHEHVNHALRGVEASIPMEVSGALDTRGGSYDSFVGNRRGGGGRGGGRGGYGGRGGGGGYGGGRGGGRGGYGDGGGGYQGGGGGYGGGGYGGGGGGYGRGGGGYRGRGGRSGY